MNHNQKQQPAIAPNALSLVALFAGIGGVETGGVMSGKLNPIASIELDPDKPALSREFEAIHDLNFPSPGSRFYRMTVQQASIKGFSHLVNYQPVGWLHASPVCSNFSNANHKKTEDQSDRDSSEAIADAIASLNPKYFSLEQVAGYKDSEAVQTVYQALQDNDYLYQWKLINVGDYGIPQDRIRYWLLGWKRGNSPLYFPLPSGSVGWYGAIADLPFRKANPDKLLNSQKTAIQIHLTHYGVKANTFLLERVACRGDLAWIKNPCEAAPTIRRMLFTDSKPGDRHHIVSRYQFIDAFIGGKYVTLSLDQVRRLCGFPDWFKSPDTPGVTGVGYGYSCIPEFFRQIAVTNL